MSPVFCSLCPTAKKDKYLCFPQVGKKSQARKMLDFFTLIFLFVAARFECEVTLNFVHTFYFFSILTAHLISIVSYLLGLSCFPYYTFCCFRNILMFLL